MVLARKGLAAIKGNIAFSTRSSLPWGHAVISAGSNFTTVVQVLFHPLEPMDTKNKIGFQGSQSSLTCGLAELVKFGMVSHASYGQNHLKLTVCALKLLAGGVV
jgi:hypothetical protein